MALKIFTSPPPPAAPLKIEKKVVESSPVTPTSLLEVPDELLKAQTVLTKEIVKHYKDNITVHVQS